MEITTYASLDKKDLEAIIGVYNDKLNNATCRLRLEELAKDAFHEEVRPIIKKLAKFVELWEELDEKERQEKERMERKGVSSAEIWPTPAASGC